jgi:Transposase DDE domain
MHMQSNLRLYHTITAQIRKWFPTDRVTRVCNLALFLTGLYLARSVHLPLIVRKWHIPGQLPSLTNRLRRFLDNPRVCAWDYYQPVAESLVRAFRGQTIWLIIDTTKLGFNAQLLTASIAYRRRALPVAWSVHAGEKGWLPVKEHIALLQQVKALIPEGSAVWLTGDCEFQHVPLLSWLTKQGWHYVLRQQGRVQVWQPGMAQTRLDAFGLQEGETRYLGWVRLGASHYGLVSMVLHWEKGQDKPWYLATDQAATWRTLQTYKRRMWIEEMHGDMKGHGFDLEATHLRDTARLSRLVLGVCLLYVWLIAVGSWVVKTGQRRQVDRKDRRDKSCFRLGWDWLERCLAQGQSLRLQFVPHIPK